MNEMILIMILYPPCITNSEIERVMNMVGAAATMLKGRLDMIYDVQSTEDGRVFSGLHDTLLPMSSKTRSVFQQLRGSKSKGKKKSKAADANAGKISGQVMGTVTGADLRHLLLLLPFLLFDLMDDVINEYNTANNKNLINPVHELIKLVLLLLEWYHLFRLMKSFLLFKRNV